MHGRSAKPKPSKENSDKAGPQMANMFSVPCPQIHPGILPDIPTHILLTRAWVRNHSTETFK